MNRRRGMTLVELLAAIALLSGVALAGAAVAQGAGRTALSASGRAEWHRAAAAVVRSIGADVACGDFDPVGDRARGDPRVRVVEGVGGASLAIRTRDRERGACTRTYLLSEGRVRVATLAAVGEEADSVALSKVRGFRAWIEEDAGMLWVEILGQGSARGGPDRVLAGYRLSMEEPR